MIGCCTVLYTACPDLRGELRSVRRFTLSLEGHPRRATKSHEIFLSSSAPSFSSIQTFQPSNLQTLFRSNVCLFIHMRTLSRHGAHRNPFLINHFRTLSHATCNGGGSITVSSRNLLQESANQIPSPPHPPAGSRRAGISALLSHCQL